MNIRKNIHITYFKKHSNNDVFLYDFRLERMRRAMRSPDSSGEQEVLIQTSTGFFRFQGISEQFTKRLYEWEQQRGIAPEASTFALLDPKFRPEAGEEAVDTAVLGLSGTLVRSKSVGSVADMTGTPVTNASDLVQSQPSSLSLNDVEALEAELEGKPCFVFIKMCLLLDYLYL